jgi:hypothetical protein
LTEADYTGLRPSRNGKVAGRKLETNFRGPHDFWEPDSNNAQALPKSVANALRLGVVAAIELDNQFGRPARKVGKIGADRELPSKLRAQARDHAPKLALMRRRAVAQGTRACGLVKWNAAAHVPSLEPWRASRTHPQPLPSREGRRFALLDNSAAISQRILIGRS